MKKLLFIFTLCTCAYAQTFTGSEDICVFKYDSMIVTSLKYNTTIGYKIDSTVQTRAAGRDYYSFYLSHDGKINRLTFIKEGMMTNRYSDEIRFGTYEPDFYTTMKSGMYQIMKVPMAGSPNVQTDSLITHHPVRVMKN